METRKNLFDYLLLFARQKVIIICVTMIAAAAAVTYSLLTPLIWTSKATFTPDASSGMSLPLNISGLGGMMSSFLGGGGSDAQNSVMIMGSRTFSEDVIRHFNLLPYLKVTDSDSLRAMDKGVEKLKTKVVGMAINEENGLISLYASTKDKQLSKSIAEYYISKLDTYNRQFKLTKGKRNRQFFEQRVAATRHTIDSLSIALRDFQTKNKALDLTTQMGSLVSLYSDAVSQQMIADMELNVAKLNYNTESPVVKELLSRKQLLSDKIKDLESSSSGVKPKYIIDIDKVPDLSQQYAQLMINLEIQKKVFEYIYPQFEAARLEELKDMPTLEMVDSPRLAGMRSAPKRGKICVFTTILAFLFSLVLAFLKDQMDSNQAVVREIRQTLFGSKRTAKK